MLPQFCVCGSEHKPTPVFGICDCLLWPKCFALTDSPQSVPTCFPKPPVPILIPAALSKQGLCSENAIIKYFGPCSTYAT